MKRNRIRGLAVAALMLIVFNVIAFVCPFAKNGVFWVAYAFSLAAILAQIPIFYCAFAGDRTVKSRFYGFPIARVGVVYLIVQLAAGLAFMLLATFLDVPVWSCAVVCVLVMALAALGLIGADTVREEIARQDGTTKVTVETMRRLQTRVSYLATQPASASVSTAVRTLSEHLRYSDPVSGAALEQVEAELESWINELQNAIVDGDEAGALSVCAKAETLLAERNHLCKLNKGNP